MFFRTAGCQSLPQDVPDEAQTPKGIEHPTPTEMDHEHRGEEQASDRAQQEAGIVEGDRPRTFLIGNPACSQTVNRWEVQALTEPHTGPREEEQTQGTSSDRSQQGKE